jgi:uncharacterized damage-inducible protein DinB
MRTRSKQLADLLARTITGPMWHGPALAELLTGVAHPQAAARPIAGAHTIWEIVLHITTWAEIGRARITGARTREPTAEQDWTVPPEPTAESWSAALAALHESYRALAADVAALDDHSLDLNVATLDDSLATLLHGVVEHGCYHGGQIALLKRASGS